MKQLLKRPLLAGIIVLAAMLFSGACKKSDSSSSAANTGKFPLTNLSYTVTDTFTSTPDLVSYNLDVKNISTQDFKATNYNISLKCTITTTDGSVYADNSYLPDLPAGQTTVMYVGVRYTQGKTLDLSKTKFELDYE